MAHGKVQRLQRCRVVERILLAFFCSVIDFIGLNTAIFMYLYERAEAAYQRVRTTACLGPNNSFGTSDDLQHQHLLNPPLINVNFNVTAVEQQTTQRSLMHDALIKVVDKIQHYYMTILLLHCSSQS
jgi:hypothetical protein